MIPLFIYDLNEYILDFLIARQSLAGKFESCYEIQGGTVVQSTDYRLIKDIIRKAPLSKDMSITDVGCGMGRFIGYLLHRGFKGNITGVEVDKTYADFCTYLFKRKKNVNIYCSDVLDFDIDPNDVVYLYNPFDETILRRFLERNRHLSKIVYCNDVHRSVLEESLDYSLEKDIPSALDDGTFVNISVWNPKS